MGKAKRLSRSMLKNYYSEKIKIDFWIEYMDYYDCPSCGKTFNLFKLEHGNERCPHCAQPFEVTETIT